jgi:hypothetical protein
MTGTSASAARRTPRTAPHAQHLRLTLTYEHVPAEDEAGQQGEGGGAADVQQPRGDNVGEEGVQEGADGLEAAEEKMGCG